VQKAAIVRRAAASINFGRRSRFGRARFAPASAACRPLRGYSKPTQCRALPMIPLYVDPDSRAVGQAIAWRSHPRAQREPHVGAGLPVRAASVFGAGKGSALVNAVSDHRATWGVIGSAVLRRTARDRAARVGDRRHPPNRTGYREMVPATPASITAGPTWPAPHTRAFPCPSVSPRRTQKRPRAGSAPARCATDAKTLKVGDSSPDG
jgi:hypothetical protein